MFVIISVSDSFPKTTVIQLIYELIVRFYYLIIHLRESTHNQLYQYSQAF